MILIVGLGNPGEEYHLTRHNTGFMAVDTIIRRYGFHGYKEKFKGLIFDGTLMGQKALILKPMTFMNLSGESVFLVSQFYKIPPQDVLVFHDDIDLAFLKVKAKVGGGSGGHNGIKSIDVKIGAEYKRIRIGVSHPNQGGVVDYVLAGFEKQEQEYLEPKFEKISDNLDCLIEGNLGCFMEKVNADGV